MVTHMAVRMFELETGPFKLSCSRLRRVFLPSVAASVFYPNDPATNRGTHQSLFSQTERIEVPNRAVDPDRSMCHDWTEPTHQRR